ncbi:hypothetical protein AAG906_010426 [Vitis piasezkii]
MEGDMFCYIHEGGELVKCVGGSVEYQDGRTECIIVSSHMSHSDFVSKLFKFNPSCLLPLHDDAAILKMFRFNEMFCRVYVSLSSEVVAACIAPTSAPTPIVGSNSIQVVSFGGDPPMDIYNAFLQLSHMGFPKDVLNQIYLNMTQDGSKIPLWVVDIPSPMLLSFGMSCI